MLSLLQNAHCRASVTTGFQHSIIFSFTAATSVAITEHTCIDLWAEQARLKMSPGRAQSINQSINQLLIFWPEVTTAAFCLLFKRTPAAWRLACCDLSGKALQRLLSWILNFSVHAITAANTVVQIAKLSSELGRTQGNAREEHVNKLFSFAPNNSTKPGPRVALRMGERKRVFTSIHPCMTQKSEM